MPSSWHVRVCFLAHEWKLNLHTTVRVDFQETRMRAGLGQHVGALWRLVNAVDLVLFAVVAPDNCIFTLFSAFDLNGCPMGRQVSFGKRQQQIAIGKHPALTGTGGITPLHGFLRVRGAVGQPGCDFYDRRPITADKHATGIV